MKQQTRFKSKKIVVIGLAISGYHAAMLLKKMGAKVTVNDGRNLDEDPHAEKLRKEGITIIGGTHPLELIDETVDYVVKNPGIPYTQEQIKKAMKLGIPILTEVQLAYDITESNVIAVTGTNGKTTTTRMIEKILNTERSTGKAYAAGNIGIAASEVAQKATKKDDIVFELSSFQLMGIDTFKPHIAVLTNIYSAHLDYHGSQEEYVKAKLRITQNQNADDYLIYNADQLFLSSLLSFSKAEQIPFSRTIELSKGTSIKNDWICYDEERIMPVADILIKGEHNLENALAAITVAKLMGYTNETIHQAMARFSGVKHRLQYVDNYLGRTFYNDSKATNALAAIQGLKSFSDPIVLIAGGLERHADLDSLIPWLSKKVRTLIVTGETAKKMAEIGKLAHVSIIKEAETMDEAVKIAYQESEEGYVILLSPACASWDQYHNFEERGDAFIKAVNDLITSQEEGTANEAGK